MSALVRATFQLVAGLGPTRERKLWDAGVTDWGQLPAAAGLLPAGLHASLLAAAAAASVALDREDLGALGRALPTAEHWRLYDAFSERAVYLDIETDVEEGITAIGLLDRAGPRLLLGGRDVGRFPDLLPPGVLLVTFNGAAFDVPVLRRAFPGWPGPAAHVDLYHLWRRLGHGGGLKALEERTGLARPDHLRGLHGRDAGWLWRHGQRGDGEALRRFAEYNLYDTVNLRTLMALGYNRRLAALGAPAPEVAVSQRGDVLYDVSKILLAL